MDVKNKMRKSQYQKNIEYRNYLEKIKKYQNAGSVSNEIVGKDPKTGKDVYRGSDGRLYTINDDGTFNYGESTNGEINEGQSSYSPIDPNDPNSKQYGVSKNYVIDEQSKIEKEKLTKEEENKIFIDTIKEIYNVQEDKIHEEDNKIVVVVPGVENAIDPTTSEAFNTQLEHNKDVYQQQKQQDQLKNEPTANNPNTSNIEQKDVSTSETVISNTNNVKTESTTNIQDNNTTNQNTSPTDNVNTKKEESTQKTNVEKIESNKGTTVDLQQNKELPRQIKDVPNRIEYKEPIIKEEESKHRRTFRERISERRQKREERKLDIEPVAPQPITNNDNTTDVLTQSINSKKVDIKEDPTLSNTRLIDTNSPYTYPADIDPNNINRDKNGNPDGTYMDENGNRIATVEKKKEIEEQAIVNTERNLQTADDEGKDNYTNKRITKVVEEKPNTVEEKPNTVANTESKTHYLTDDVQTIDDFEITAEGPKSPEVAQRIQERRGLAQEKIEKELKKIDDPYADRKDIDLNIIIARLERYFSADTTGKFATPEKKDLGTISDYDRKNQNFLESNSAMTRNDATYNIDKIVPGYNKYNTIASKRTTHKVLKDFDALNHMGRLFKKPSLNDKETAYNLMNDKRTQKGFWLETLKKEARPLDKMRINRIKRREKRFEKELDKQENN